MNETEWLASEDPGAMLDSLRAPGHWPEVSPLSPRRLRLFACACVRLAWGRLDDRSREAVGCAEAWADGATPDDRERHGLGASTHTGCLIDNVADAARQALRLSAARGAPPAAQAALLRDVRGSPFRPALNLDEHGWVKDRRSLDLVLSWRLNPGVQALARAAYAEGREVPCGRCGGSGREAAPPFEPDFGPCPDCGGTGRTSDGLLDPDHLAVLADALEEAGCWEEPLLWHLRGQEQCPSCLWLGEPPRRGPYQAGVHCSRCHGARRIPLRGPHARGCHALDLILGKE